MIRKLPSVALAASLVLVAACDRKPAAGESAGPSAVAAAIPAVASHLGFATRVPQEVDLFVSGYQADSMLRAQAELLPYEMSPEDKGELEKILALVGDEAFLFVGPGAGAQLKMVGTTYRDASAAWSEAAVSAMLDLLAAENEKPDFNRLTDTLSADLAEKWLDVLEKDSRLQVPSVVIGWRPAEEKLNDCLQAVGEGLDHFFAIADGVAPVSFEAAGVRLTGYEIPSRKIFGDGIGELHEKLKENAAPTELLEQLSPERVERLLTAMEKLRLTVATGVTDGRVVVYLGDGPQGFRLAASSEESLAASQSLRWTAGLADDHVAGVAYLSEPMVGAALPWLDLSETWKALARAVRAPIRDERLFHAILTRLAETEHELAARDTSAWCAVIYEDAGWRYESQGGWPDPTLDYEAPLRMTDAVVAAQPAIRAQWVQNRDRNDLAWQQNELLATLVKAVVGEMAESEHSMAAMAAEGPVPRAMLEVARLNTAYRDEFRAGIGDEVALILDFQGEIPPVPGISEETVRDGKAPRFLLARPVTDRTMLTAAGKSFVASWRDLTAWGSELSGQNLPLIQPQSLESGGLITWYPPMPFIGGDFVPGVTLNDQLWMVGTSRSMAADFSKAVEASSGHGGTGMSVEIDAAPIRTWMKSMYQLNQEEAEALIDQSPEELREMQDQGLDQLKSASDRIQGVSYRKWLEAGVPRTSLHLRLNQD